MTFPQKDISNCQHLSTFINFFQYLSTFINFFDIYQQATPTSKFRRFDATKDVVDPHLQRRLDVDVVGAGLRVSDRPQSPRGHRPQPQQLGLHARRPLVSSRQHCSGQFNKNV